MTNFKFNFSESGPGSVHIPPNTIFLSFQTFKGTLKMLQITSSPQIQQEKILKACVCYFLKIHYTSDLIT